LKKPPMCFRKGKSRAQNRTCRQVTEKKNINERREKKKGIEASSSAHVGIRNSKKGTCLRGEKKTKQEEGREEGNGFRARDQQKSKPKSGKRIESEKRKGGKKKSLIQGKDKVRGRGANRGR